MNEKSQNEVIRFVGEIINIDDIDIDIIKNASYVKDDEKIIGVLSYEKFTCIGLIRYFIFKESVSLATVIALFEDVKQSAKEDNIICFSTIVTKEKIIKIFEELGFLEYDKNNVFIDEVSFLDSNYKDAHILNYIL